ncbi:tyrosine-type recombinase/integrase [Mesorhizobium sp. ORM16]|uniref:tyrosine-type recombinase/integrase n=1 Tax=Mesorhizobium sp. ORM16 TaxID=3376989 RepID=UPI003857B6B0
MPAIYRTHLLLLYGSGMRIGEALRLVLQNVDLTEQIITVRGTKFFKTRLVPIGPKLNCELAAHIERRRLLPLSRGQESLLVVGGEERRFR